MMGMMFDDMLIHLTSPSLDYILAVLYVEVCDDHREERGRQCILISLRILGLELLLFIDKREIVHVQFTSAHDALQFPCGRASKGSSHDSASFLKG